MKNSTKISVIIPAYNVENYIEKTIQSVLSQSFAEYEVIVVDDGSLDQTGAICDRYAENNSQISVFHQKNGGVMAARLKGVEISKGDWITFLDGDDRLPPDSLLLLYNVAVTKNVDLVWGARATIDDDNNILDEKKNLVGYFDNKKYTKIISSNPRSLHGMLFRKHVVSEPIVIDRKITNGEDQLYNLLISNRVRNAYSIENIVHFYINRCDSATKRIIQNDYWYLFISYVGECYKKYGVNELAYQRFILTRVNSIIRNSSEIIDCSNTCFESLKTIHYSILFNIKMNMILFVLKHPYKVLIHIMRMHPSRILKLI
jgi:glycosyltransferase involved in cell wall biosynthesis